MEGFDTARFDVSFTRASTSEGSEYRIRLEDRASGQIIADLVLTGEQAAEFLTGRQMTNVPGMLLREDLRPRLGKRMEHYVVKFGRLFDDEQRLELKGWAEGARILLDADTATITKHNWGTSVRFRWYLPAEAPELDMSKVEEMLPGRPESVPAAPAVTR